MGRRLCVRGLRTLGGWGLWLILWGCGRCLVADGSNARTGGGTRRRVATRRAEGRQRSRPLSNVGRRTASPNISAQAAEQLRPRERFPPFVFSLPPLSDLYRVFTKRPQFRQSLKSAAEYIYNLHARRIYNILHERAIIILSYTHTPARPCLFFSFFFFVFSFLFFFCSFIFSFSFILLFFSFRFSSFLFAFRFSFLFFLFSLLAFLQPFRRRQEVIPNKTPGGVKRIQIKEIKSGRKYKGSERKYKKKG